MSNKRPSTSADILLVIDPSIYSLSALQRAAYDLMDKVVLHFEKKDEHILIKTASPQAECHFDREAFLSAALDHQIRIDLERQYAPIREIIVAQALQPRDDLANVLVAHMYAGPPKESV